MGIFRKPTVRVEQIASSLRTGDIYLGRGTMSISRLIELTTLSPWSHVGMIVMPHDIGRTDLPAECPMLWESNVYDEHVLDYNRSGPPGPKDGTMLVKLEDRVNDNARSGHYEAMAIRYLRDGLSDDAKRRLRAYLEREDIREAIFANFLDMIWAFIRLRLFHQVPIVKQFYCSHLIAETYQTMGVLSDTEPPRSYLPRDFCSLGYAPFLQRLSPAREVYLWNPLRQRDEREKERG